jgi:hypothetical protein
MYWHWKARELNGAGQFARLFDVIQYFDRKLIMANEASKSREQTEVVFAGVQSQFYGRGGAAEEMDAVVAAREEKTARLREARLAKDRRDMMAAAAAKLSKRAKA